ncbi:hypothetical protein Bca4012_049145 [Brassica carinata]|uniref:No apical meristem-associated C-terminal domain-containing protein n=1 Tax=Brassica carinata TaxID=52824 RepID=A0A8X7R8X2_BRACI|nr:hypothetical protein Bca52824_051939 [Brassica carinata]
MDPKNLQTQSSSYVGLLQSQQGSVFHEKFPYESFHSSVNFGESEIPAFSSQQSENASVDTPTNTQTSSNNVVDTESRPKGIKAAKAKRNTAKGKSVAEYATIWEMKKEDLEMKERLSKLAILDTLLAKKEPLSEAEEVVKNKLLADYSQPSEDEDLFGNSVDSGYSETDDLIRRDQAEISLHAGSPVQYPPQPEVEFGFPQICYCGAQPLVATSNSRNDPGKITCYCLAYVLNI